MEYAIYKGDEFLFMGTEREVLNRFGWSKKRLAWINSIYSEKLDNGSENGWLVAVRLNDLFNEEEKIKYDIDDDSIDTKVYRTIREDRNITDIKISEKLNIDIETVRRAKRRLRKRGNVI